MKSRLGKLALVATACVATSAALLACGGGGGGGGAGFPLILPPAANPPASEQPGQSGQPGEPVVPAGPTALTCNQLQGMAIPAASIGLPTTGATVTAAKPIAASGTGVAAVPAYCEVSGKIAPVDPAAPNILFQVGLPENWNQKIVMFGGGGFDGTIPSVKSNVPNGPVDKPTPLGRGYAPLPATQATRRTRWGPRTAGSGSTTRRCATLAGTC